MRIHWKRALSLALTSSALAFVSACSSKETPVAPGLETTRSAKASAMQDPIDAAKQGAASVEVSNAASSAPEIQNAAHSDHDGHDHGSSGDSHAAPVPAPMSDLATKLASMDSIEGERGLDELDMGFDVGSIKIDLGGNGLPATGLPIAGSGLRKPTLPTTSTRGGMRLARGESAEHAFGDVREGEAYEKVFKFVSDGESALVVKTIKPSCGCTRSEIELTNADGSTTPYELGQEIQTGQKFNLLTEISTDGKHGHTEVTVMMTSNDPKGQTGIKLTAEVEKVLELEPPDQMVLIDEMTVLEQRTHSVQVRSTRGEMFRLGVGPEIQLPESIHLAFTPIEPDAEGRAATWDVSMLLGPGLDEGRRNYPIYLASDLVIPSPKYPSTDGSPKFFTAMLSVQVNVIGLVSASPSFMGFGIVKPGQELVRTVEIRCADDTKLAETPEVKILGLYDDNPQYADAYEISFEPLEGENGMRMSVRLKGMSEEVKGSFGGRIEVAIGHPAKETLTVKFSGICRASLPGQ